MIIIYLVPFFFFYSVFSFFFLFFCQYLHRNIALEFLFLFYNRHRFDVNKFERDEEREDAVRLDIRSNIISFQIQLIEFFFTCVNFDKHRTTMSKLFKWMFDNFENDWILKKSKVFFCCCLFRFQFEISLALQRTI